MKLAEALMERADLNRRIAEIENRIENNVLVQEGEQPLEDPDTLLQEMNGMMERLEYLMAHINLTNCNTVINNQTLTELIARKDTLNLRLINYRNIANSASQNTHRARGTEIRILSTIDVKDMQKQIDQTAKEIRQLDNLLQSTNWQTELL